MLLAILFEWAIRLFLLVSVAFPLMSLFHYSNFHLLHIASISNYTQTTTIANNPNSQVTLYGIALQYSTSVRAVRFEPSSTCTSTLANPTAGTLNATSYVSSTSMATLTAIVGGVGLAPGTYSVCVDLTGNPVTGNFQQIGPSLLLVGLSSFFHQSLCIFQSSIIMLLEKIQSPPRPSHRSPSWLMTAQLWLRLLVCL